MAYVALFVTRCCGSHVTPSQACRPPRKAGLPWKLVCPLTDQNRPCLDCHLLSRASLPPADPGPGNPGSPGRAPLTSDLPQRFGLAFLSHLEGVKPSYANCPLDPPEFLEGRRTLLRSVTHSPQGKGLACVLHLRETTLVLLQQTGIRLLHLCLIRKVAGSFSH